MTDFLIQHAAFERSNPEELEYAQLIERSRQKVHAATHGSLDGYVSPREWPCPGWLRTSDRIGLIHVVVCDACGFETTLKERPLSESVPAGQDWRVPS